MMGPSSWGNWDRVESHTRRRNAQERLEDMPYRRPVDIELSVAIGIAVRTIGDDARLLPFHKQSMPSVVHGEFFELLSAMPCRLLPFGEESGLVLWVSTFQALV